MRAPSQPPELPPKRLGVVFSFAGPLLNIGEAMPAKPPVIVHSTYRPKRARKRKQSIAIPMRIVTAKPPKNACSAERRRSGAGDREAAHRLGKEAEGRLATCPTWQRRNTNGARCAKMDGNAKAIASNGNPISLTSSTRGF